MENLKEQNSATMSNTENEQINEVLSIKEVLGKEYKSLARAITELRSVLGSCKRYPVANRGILHIIRHDVLALHGVTRRVYYTFEDMTDEESQSVDALNELIRTATHLMMDYLKDANSGRCERGDNVDREGWNIEMRSSVFDGRLYAIDFCLFNLGFDNPEKEIDFDLSLSDVEEIMADIREKLEK